ncbi:Sorbitol operon regulator [Eubacteriaceae bacterium CHKCI004]|nr:Sorbitol operon regulator [Eubacteriaceae bacterium CHKCI004]
MEEKNLYIKIAHWYYTLGMTQDEIAKRLSFTRQKVNRIINSLVAQGIVSITVNGYNTSHVSYESALEEYFHIRRVIIAESYDMENDFLPTLADRAAQFLESFLQTDMTIGVSWGKTLAAVISRLPYKRRSDCTVVQMVGAQNITGDRMLKSDEIARSLANKLDCACYMFYAPTVVDHPETKTMLMKERTIQKSYEWMKQCDVGLFGIGQLTKESTMFQRGFLKEKDISQLQEDGFVGDICMNHVRLDGSWDDNCMENRLNKAGMDILKNIPNVIAIAGGADKTDAIIGCLNSGVVDILIIDDLSAERIVKTLKIS